MRPLCLVPLLVLLLAGCQQSQQDPFERADTWKLPPDSLAANDANLRAMVMNPADLVAGKGDEGTGVAQLATHPVRDLFAGKRAPLPSSGATTQLQQQSQPQQQGAGGAGGNGDQ